MDDRADTRSGQFDKAKGRIKEAVGGAKKKVGRELGDDQLEAEGSRERGEGKIDRAKGAVKETVEDATDTVRAGAAIAKEKLDRATNKRN
jgi:uncharacterized protein YjbJ (UPF0337 family)